MAFDVRGFAFRLNIYLRSFSSSVVVKYSRTNFSEAPWYIGVQLEKASGQLECTVGNIVKYISETYYHKANIKLPATIPAAATRFR